MKEKQLSDYAIFDLAIQNKDWGIRLDEKYSPKELQDYKRSHLFFIDGYRAKSKGLLKPFPRTIYDYIYNFSFNAHAFKYKAHYVIGINVGIWAILNDLFHRMLAHRDILPEIGNPEKESSVNSIDDYYDNVIDLIINTPLDKYKLKFPKNLHRLLYAYHLSGRALDFVFEHELAHILFGHADYLSDCFGIHCVSEYQPSEVVNKNQFSLQTLEMHADTMALQSCCFRALNVVNNNSLVNPRFRVLYKNYYQALSDLAFAIYNTIRMFGDGDYKNTQLGKSTHPDPRVRQVILLSFLEQFMSQQQSFNIDYDKLHSLLIKTIKESENAYQLITGKQTDFDVFNAKYFANNPFNSEVVINWKRNIRKRLLKYTYVPLPT
ncbi:MAG TPA: hypothetical protein ENH82_04045 [bacterium]|nr:hypothetical protein [bacterium]